MTTCPDAKTLAARVAGDLTTNDAARLDLHVGTCAACRSTLERLARLTSALPEAIAEPDDASFAARVSARLEERRPAQPALRFAIPALAAVAIASVFLLVPGRETEEFTARGTTIDRPDRWVGFDARTHAPGTTGEGTPLGATLRQGDGLSFVATNRSENDLHVALFGLDAQGHVHWFHPAWLDASTDPQSPLLKARERRAFDEAIAPEATPGPLRIVALFTPKPVSVRAVERSLTIDGVAGLSRDYPDAALQLFETTVTESR